MTGKQHLSAHDTALRPVRVDSSLRSAASAVRSSLSRLNGWQQMTAGIVGLAVITLIAINPIRNGLLVAFTLATVFAFVAPAWGGLAVGLFAFSMPISSFAAQEFRHGAPWISQSTLALCILVAAAAGRWRRREPWDIPQRVRLPLLILGVAVVWAIGTVVVHRGLEWPSIASLGMGLGWVTFSVLGLAGAVRRGVAALTAGLVVVAVVDVVGLLTGVHLFPTHASPLVRNYDSSTLVARFVGSFGDYELLAEWMALAILASIWLSMTSTSLRQRYGWLASLLPLGVVLLATGTRSALVLLMPMAVLLILFTAPRLRMRRLNAVALVGGVVAVAVAIVGVAALSGQANVLDRLLSIKWGGSFADAVNRSSVWVPFTARGDFREHWLVGNGLPFPFDVVGTYPHNLYLFTIYTIGAIGLSLFAVALGWLVVVLMIRSTRDGRQAPARLLLVLAAFVLLDESKIELTRLPQTTWLAWGLLGLAFACAATPPRQRQSDQTMPASDTAAAIA